MGRHFPIFAAALVATTLTVAPDSAAAQVASSDEQTRIALAEQIAQIAFPEDQREEIFAKVIDQTEAQVMQSVKSHIPDEEAMAILADFQQGMRAEQNAIVKRHIPLLIDGWSRAYADTFSAAELQDILTFVRTDSGRAYMQRSSSVISNPHLAAANQAYMDEITSITFAAVPSLMEKLAAYQAKRKADAN